MVQYSRISKSTYCRCLISLTLCLLLVSKAFASDHFDPYATLGIRRDASEQTIRRAYKVLARKWHPDKNKHPKAQDMFVKITDAYNILSNAERKYKYDTFGTIKEDPNSSDDRGFGFHNFQQFQGFHSFFGSTGNQNIQFLTDHIYEYNVLPKSHKTPQLIYVYGDWCFQCMQLELIWESAVKDLKSFGVGAFDLNYQYSRRLNSKLNANHYPQFIAVVNGRIFKYSSNEFSTESLRHFVRNSLPSRIVQQINTETYLDFFRKSFIANKPQAILFSNKMEVPLLFLLLAFEYHKSLEFAYVNSNNANSDELRKRYGVLRGEQVFLIMKEEPSSPEVILKDSSLSQKAIRKAISGNLFFHLPRLSSPEVFDGICPISSKHQTNYCVVLFTISSQDHSYQRFILRKLAKDQYWRENGVHFMYISEDVQKSFGGVMDKPHYTCRNQESALNAWGLGQWELWGEAGTAAIIAIVGFPLRWGFYCSASGASVASLVPGAKQTLGSLLVFARQSASEILYDWVDGGWCVDEPDEAMNKLKGLLNIIIDRDKLLVKQANISYIYDEHQPHIFLRLANHLNSLLDYISDLYKTFGWNSSVSLAINTLLVGVIFLIAVLLPMTGRSKPDHADESDLTVLGIAKLKAKYYNKFSNTSPPGQFTVIVLLDIESLSQAEKSPILQAFSDVIYPFTRGDMFTFAWVSIQEQLSWCAEIMDVKEFGKVLPGIVLALNGRKKYVYIFKPTDSVNIEKSADFIGLESDGELDDEELDSQASRNQKLATRSIRVLLPMWLERLYDGTLTDRVKVDSWPRLDQ